MSIKKDIIIRLGLIYFLLSFLGLAIVVKIFIIQHINTEKWLSLTNNLQSVIVATSPIRGDIISDNGNLLATSMPGYFIRIDMKSPGVKKVFYSEVSLLSKQLSDFFKDKDANRWKNELIKAYKKGNRGFLVTPRKIDYNELKIVKEFAIINKGQFKGGRIIEQEYRRVLPFGRMAKRTIGQLNKGIYGGIHGAIGYTGLEGAYETFLKGNNGVSYRQNISGRWMVIPFIEPKPGSDIHTTINIKLQDILEQSLLKQLIKSYAAWGTAILMEVKTGDVKAICNLGEIAPGQYDETYNYAIGHEGCFEPGSTFKLMSVMAGLEEGCIDLSDKINVEYGKWEYKGRTILDSDYGHSADTWLTIQEIFEKSSNVGIAKAITTCFGDHPKQYTARIYNFGINKSLNLGFPGEATPFFKYPNEPNWWGTTLAWMSYGYESKMTPIQILTFYNAIANNGRMIKPRFVTKICDQGRLIKEIDVEVIKSSISSKETLSKAKLLLEGVCSSGTGKTIQPEGFKVAGKTGTAQVAVGSGGYNKGMYMASFVGYFPAENPIYSMIVVINNPKGAYYGASVAGPVFKETAEKTYTMYTRANECIDSNNVSLPIIKKGNFKSIKLLTNDINCNFIEAGSFKDDDLVSIMKSNLSKDTMLVYKLSYKFDLMPRLYGMNITDAIFLLSLYNVKTSITGLGKVVEQVPCAGVRLVNGQNVYLKLN